MFSISPASDFEISLERPLDARPASPLMRLCFTVLAVVSYRIFLAMHLGPELYRAAIESLAQGNLIQQLLARCLELDEFSQMLIDVFRNMIG